MSSAWHYGPQTEAVWERARVPVMPADWNDAGVPERFPDASVEYFRLDPEWQEYLARVAPGRSSFVDVQVSPGVKRVQRRRTRQFSVDDAEIDVLVKVPLDPVVNLSWWRVQALFGLVARDTWVWLAGRFGFPVPPGLPGPLAQWCPEELVDVAWRGVEASPQGREVVNAVEWRASGAAVADRSAGVFRGSSAWQEWLDGVDPRERHTVVCGSRMWMVRCSRRGR